MKIEIKYNKYFDLIFHVLAYLKVNNASNLYNKEYINKIAIEKQNFEYNIIPNIDLLEEYYNINFERLMLINFLPFYCNSFEEIKNIFFNCNHFTTKDLQYFINPFIEILDNESIFFFDYWDKLHKHNENLRYLAEETLKSEFEKFSCVFDFYDKSALALLSYSITRNGRGFDGINSYFSAVVPFPENEDNFNNSFITLLHEYTHQFTDDLLRMNINMKDGSHNLSENVVILTDYYLIKSIDEKLIQKYFELFMNGSKETNESEFLNIYKVDKNLKLDIKKLIDNIL